MNHELRIDQVRKVLIESGADVFITERPLDLRYFCGTIDPRGLLIIPAHEQVTLFVPSASVEEAKYLVKVAQVYPVAMGSQLSDSLPLVLKEPGLVFLGEISGTTRLAIQNLAPKFQLRDFVNFPETLQRHKSAEELTFIRKAVGIAELGIQTAIRLLNAQISELELAAQVTQAMMLDGAETMWFPVQVLSGYRSVFADARTSRKLIDRGELCIVDVGPLFEGYTGDLTRSFVHGKLSQDQKRQLEWTKEAQGIALSYVREGVAVADIYQSVVDYFSKLGVSQFFPHALGHGLGLLTACSPYLRPDVNDNLLTGDVITIEPGLYIPGIGGCRIEDVVIVTNNGYERISHLPISWEVE